MRKNEAGVIIPIDRLKPALVAEFIFVYVGAPLLILILRERWLMIGLLWVGGALTYIYVRRYKRPAADDIPFLSKLKPALIRFAIIAPLVSLIVWLTLPGDFLSFPRERPQLWATVMVLYPLLSVWPQEVIYRAFLHRRYAPLFGNGRGYVLASALAFGYMHVIFLNWIAVVMTLVGGYIFASDYARCRSLWVVTIEHALYGCLIFTTGLGRFFYSGAAWG